MNRQDDDQELVAAFAALRREEREQCPPFAEVMRRDRSRSRRSESPRRPRQSWAAAAATLLVVLAVLAAWLGLRTPGARLPSGGAPSLAEWRSPTDFLLETPGREILDPAGLDRSLLDFNPTPPSQERRSPS
ncbi:MAG TPA: hypothetical protein VIA62_04485 [Thermoanaerobaculia bacterium]|jgi:hypothetical protein|nr:hypothetical protein [Thermoanaerobaculia bacterium]